MVGCQDGDGVDGMVFMFVNRLNWIGYRGEGIGFVGLSFFFGIEIDIW